MTRLFKVKGKLAWFPCTCIQELWFVLIVKYIFNVDTILWHQN